MLRRFLLVMWFVPAVGLTQEKQDKKVDVRPLVLHPAALPVPALKYSLLPEVRDMKPGNAALLYQRSHSPEWWNSVARDETFQKIEWFAGPLDAFPRKEADKMLAHRGVLKEVDLAARRLACDWEMLDRLRDEGASLLLPDVQSFRSYGTLLGIRSRRALLDRKFGDAAASMQSGFALGRHVAEGPTLINFLVGVAISNITTTPVEDWVQIPGSPNLYWALTDLPNPLLSYRKNLQAERLLVEAFYPGAQDALRDPTKSAPLNVTVLSKQLEPLRQLGDDFIPKNFLAEAWITLKLNAEARKFLINNGRTVDQVNAMGQQQIVALYLVSEYCRWMDEVAKLSTLPFWEAYPLLQQADAELRKDAAKRPEAMMLPRLLIPAMKNVAVAQARTDRRIALLRSFEALRLHASLNQGQLLVKWDDLRGIPIPLDPATGRPFDYRRDGDRAVLTLSPLPGRAEAEIRYEISMAK